MSLICQIGLDQVRMPANRKDHPFLTKVGRGLVSFNSKDIQEGAESILALGGLIRPIMVRDLGYNGIEKEYELISGEFELAAMFRAHELKPSMETIECIVCGGGELDENELKKAIQVFTNKPFSTQPDSDTLWEEKYESLRPISYPPVAEPAQVKQFNFDDSNEYDLILDQDDNEVYKHSSCIITQDSLIDNFSQFSSVPETEPANLDGLIDDLSPLSSDPNKKEAMKREKKGVTVKTGSNKIKSLIIAFLAKKGRATTTNKEVYLHLLNKGCDLNRQQVGARLAYLTKKGTLKRPTRGNYLLVMVDTL